jgi:hypothetical protein
MVENYSRRLTQMTQIESQVRIAIQPARDSAAAYCSPLRVFELWVRSLEKLSGARASGRQKLEQNSNIRGGKN